MKSVFDRDKVIDLDPDGTTIRELNKAIHELTIEVFDLIKKVDELQEAYNQEMWLNGEMSHQISELLKDRR
jgi:predicted RNase H-like nuclease (RuvC/YqgF family)